jgi:hypothetical protein
MPLGNEDEDDDEYEAEERYTAFVLVLVLLLVLDNGIFEIAFNFTIYSSCPRRQRLSGKKLQ